MTESRFTSHIHGDQILAIDRKYAPGLVEEPPASSVLQVVSLSRANMLIEIDVTAVTAEKKN